MSLKNHIEDEIIELEVHDLIYLDNIIKNIIKNKHEQEIQKTV